MLNYVETKTKPKQILHSYTPATIVCGSGTRNKKWMLCACVCEMGLIAHIYIYIFSWLLAEHQSILSVHIFWLLAAGINPRQNPKGTQETVMTFHTSMASIALELSVNVYYAYVSGVYVCVWQHKFVVCAMCVSCVLMCCVCISLAVHRTVTKCPQCIDIHAQAQSYTRTSNTQWVWPGSTSSERACQQPNPFEPTLQAQKSRLIRIHDYSLSLQIQNIAHVIQLWQKHKKYSNRNTIILE